MQYGSSRDPYCYPETTVLKNKRKILDQALLERFELAKYLARSQSPWPPGKLDKSHYYALHRHFFQDVYDWAGKPRTIRIGKGGNWFCTPISSTASSTACSAISRPGSTLLDWD